MLRPRVALLVAPIFLAGPVQAQLSIWNGPGADWNNAANWSAGVPDPGETALFNGATPKAVAVAGAGVDIATIQFDPHAPPGYTFAINSTSFALTGAGVVNNSAQAPTFNISAFAFLDFYGAASAGNAIIGSNSSFISFNDSANAANAQITLANSLLSFASDGTTAGSAAITNNSGGTTQFLGASTAGGATIANNAGGTTSFSNSSNAGSATINNNAASSNLRFSDTSRAGTANITNRGTVSFGALGNGDTASADRATIINDGLSAVTRFFGFTRGGNATITANNGSQVLFFENSTGENARFIVDATSRVDFSGTRGLLNDGRVSAGSIEGAGTVILPDGTLTIGSNNLSTDFSGTLTQCGCNPGRLEKIGIGTLTLSEINGYSGGTTIAAGTLVMAHATAGAIDAVGTGNVTLNGGALRSTVTGTLANDVTFGSGTTSTLAAANGTTLTLIGTGTFSDSVARFGSVSDAGTIIASFAGTGSSNTTAIEVNGGILRAGSSGFTS
ncbi:MAG: autotransporter-associated beta strand repeat-containing protein, partial [Mycobacteriaceae bacterium]|nr:autotransporter-associated beta strand repeat-containing protein [Mycobacteriaceae bacterium]